MIEVRAKVLNSQGIHCRPSAVITKECMRFDSEIEITGSAGVANPKSIISLIALGLAEGDEVTIRATGPDEKKASQRMAELFGTHFDFPPIEGEGGSDAMTDAPRS